MKTLKLLSLSLFVLFAFGCSTDQIQESEENNQIVEDIQTRGGGSSSIYIQGYIVVEWEMGTSQAERAAVRQNYMDLDYLISWEHCTFINRELWYVNFCKTCQPWHDPEDDPKVRNVYNEASCD